MNELKCKMISEARSQYRQIYPCAMHGTLDDCFTVEENRILFWFNTEDRTTHIMSAELG